MTSYEIKKIMVERGFELEEYKTLWDGLDRSDNSIIVRLIGPKGGIYSLGYYFNSNIDEIIVNAGNVKAALDRFPDMPESMKFFLWSLI